MRRVAGYLASSTAASLVYIVWFLISITRANADAPTTLGFSLGFSLFFWLSGGFSLALLVMVFAWAFAVWVYRRLRWPGGVYFPVVGALVVFVTACAMSSVSPKPLWIEDQTFVQGALIAAARQGLCFSVSGIAFGASYWFLTERYLPLPPTLKSATT